MSLRRSMPLAMVFNQYLETSGGGERLSFEVASALEQAGYEVHFVIVSPTKIDVDALALAFGIKPKRTWPLINAISERDMRQICKNGGYEVFVNNSYHSSFPNPAPIGIFVGMFPQRLSERQREAIATYSFIQSISHFTELYTIRRWGFDNVKVLVAPISDIHFSEPRVAFKEKEKLILSVGRFNVRGHTKRQLDAIKAFVEMQETGVLDPDWRLVVAGRINPGEENLKYLGTCLKAANHRVTIAENLPLDELRRLYRKASVLWQFTGFGKDFGFNPEECEHLGLVALDCFAYGTLPMVYQRGGMPYLIDHGVNGYCFGSTSELATIMKAVARGHRTWFHEFQFLHAQQSAERYRFSVFADSIARAIQQAKAGLAVSGAEPLMAGSNLRT